MVDGSKVTSMIVLIIIGIIIIIFGGLTMWKYYQDQKIVKAAVANGSIPANIAATLPNPFWVYGLSIVQIILGVILVIWGIAQYFAGSKHIAHIKEYGSRLLSTQPAVVQPVVAEHTVPATTEVKTTYVPTVGSRRAVKI